MVAVSVTTWVPGVVKLVEGFVKVEELDGPNDHTYVVPLDGLVVLVKFTTSGAHPDVGAAVNPAVSANELALKQRLSNK